MPLTCILSSEGFTTIRTFKFLFRKFVNAIYVTLKVMFSCKTMITVRIIANKWFHSINLMSSLVSLHVEFTSKASVAYWTSKSFFLILWFLSIIEQNFHSILQLQFLCCLFFRDIIFDFNHI